MNKEKQVRKAIEQEFKSKLINHIGKDEFERRANEMREAKQDDLPNLDIDQFEWLFDSIAIMDEAVQESLFNIGQACLKDEESRINYKYLLDEVWDLEKYKEIVDDRLGESQVFLLKYTDKYLKYFYLVKFHIELVVDLLEDQIEEDRAYNKEFGPFDEYVGLDLGVTTPDEELDNLRLYGQLIDITLKHLVNVNRI